ncbi:SMC-Scp complex subunit ScpB [Oleiharenicola lentus]|uniref:SMC-Scp complex subunit ScpB n=1 Tax=Oleiharenicola lentus TaxID=2508720 RepID=A0A4Q1CAQ4_9BACT|nr:SMC-Scp complex subunit ScpB [Oleiharenicola lentus]RXK55961.1 SMC-Scp complex subunit ScpB [Oleiharenicola lentus]
MAFDLKRVLKVMLFASNGPLSVKDIQTAVSRFHEQATSLPLEDAPAGDAPGAGAAETTEAAPVPAVAGEAPVESTDALVAVPVEDDEFYRDVPTLVTAAEIREAMEAISLEMQATGSETVLVEGSMGWRLASHPRFARWVRLLRNEPPPVRLSPSSLETLAVVAYRQPVTRAEIEQIRGVSAEAGITKLLERDLIYIVGRADLPGRPIQYGTTEAFLEFVGIKSLDELPASDVLSPRQIDAWLQTSANPRPAGDADMGLDETEEDQMSLPQGEAAPVEAAPAEKPEGS